MKIYAKQVPPELQQSPLFLGDEFFPDNICVFGNRDYIEHSSEIVDKIWNVLQQGELVDVLEHIKEWANYYKNATDAINDFLPPEKKTRYSTNEIHVIRNCVIDFSCCVCSREYEILCKIFSIVTGQKWDYKIIKGYCQNEWNYIFYPVDEWTQTELNVFEMEYFNMGTEWIIDDGTFNPKYDTPDNINGCSVYCTAENEDDIKKYISNYEGVNPENIVLYTFEGWNKIASYKEV